MVDGHAGQDSGIAPVPSVTMESAVANGNGISVPPRNGVGVLVGAGVASLALTWEVAAWLFQLLFGVALPRMWQG